MSVHADVMLPLNSSSTLTIEHGRRLTAVLSTAMQPRIRILGNLAWIGRGNPLNFR